MLKKLFYSTCFFVLFTTLPGCFKYEEVKMVRMVDMGVESITPKGVDLYLDMQIKNPNNYKISIVGSDLDLFVKDKKSGKINLKNKVTLPKNSNEVHHFVFESDYKNFSADPLTIISTVLGDKRTVKVHVKGTIKAKAKGVGKKFPVDVKERVTL